MKTNDDFQPIMAKIFFDLFVVERSLANLFDSVYTKHGLTTKQWLVLAVATNIDRPTIQNISKVLDTSHQNIKAISINLEKSGFVSLVNDPSDKRSTLVIATKKLESLNKERGKNDEDNMALLFGKFNEAEIDIFSDYLNRLQSQITDIKDQMK